MNTGLLDVLHHSTDIQRVAVVQRVDVNLDCIVEESVDQQWVTRANDALIGDAHKVVTQRVEVIDNLHAATAKNV